MSVNPSHRLLSRSSLLAKLVVPFIIGLATTILVLGIYCLGLWKSTLTQELEKTGEAIAKDMSFSLAEPYSMGEYDRMQAMVTSAKQVNEDMEYALLVGTDGRCAAATDEQLRNLSLKRNDFETSALDAKAMEVVPLPAGQHGFEIRMPIIHFDHTLGILRIGISLSRVDKSVRKAAMYFLLVALIALVAGAAFYTWLAGWVSAPIHEVIELAHKMAQGDLRETITVTHQDEVGRLQSAMRAMTVKLVQVIGELRNATLALSTASEEMSTSAESISQATSNQTSSVEETSSSLEQINASIHQNADHSRKMEQMALQGAVNAEESGRAVHETLQAIQAIAEKISVIEEITYQTNMLALNASIEAARAGEHGKGFAVVATEVRSLAERSKAAAAEIGGLAASSVKVAERSGQLLSDLVPTIKKTAELVREVASASREQAAGVVQINKAMDEVNKSTTQGASSAQQLSVTAGKLSAQARTLQSLIQFFRLAEDEHLSSSGFTEDKHRSSSGLAKKEHRSSSGLAKDEHRTYVAPPAPVKDNGHREAGGESEAFVPFTADDEAD